MAENPKIGDFVAVSYIGKVADSGEVFDLTGEKEAKEHNLFSDNVIYGPMVVRLGSGHMLKGLEDAVLKMSPGEKKTVRLGYSDAFGPRDPGKIQTVLDKIFKEKKPMPGMIVNVRGLMGKVQSVTGGRVVIDFNHPLAGKDVEYEFTLEKIVTDVKEKFAGILRLNAHKGQESNFSVNGDSAEVIVPADNPIPKETMAEIAEETKSGIPEIKKVKFSYLFE